MDRVVELANALEEAWKQDAHVAVPEFWYEEFCVKYVVPWIRARETARKTGLREVLLSEEAVVALRRGVVLSHAASAAMCADGGRAQREYDEQVRYAFDLLVRDLGSVVKEKTDG